MTIQRSLQQMFRRPQVTIPYLLLICLLAAFLSIGLELMNSSVNMAAKTENSFDTIGVVEFFQDVPTDASYYSMQARLDNGSMTEERYKKNHEAYLNGANDQYLYPLKDGKLQYTGETIYRGVQRSGFDLSSITKSPYVMKAETRARYGAYIDGLKQENNLIHTSACRTDLLIFTPELTETMTYDGSEGNREVTLPVHIEYSLQAELRGLNSIYGLTSLSVRFCLENSEYPILMEPGKTYAAICHYSFDPQYINDMDLSIRMPYFESAYYNQYTIFDEGDMAAPLISQDHTLFCEYSDGFFDTVEGTRMKRIAQALETTFRSATVMTTDDLLLFMPFHNNSVYIREGRAFTDEEYTKGEQVCLLSYDLAQSNGWRVGDEISMGLYGYDNFSAYALNSDYGCTWNYQPVFLTDQSEIFSQQTYRIIGLYDGGNLYNGKSMIAVEGEETEQKQANLAQSRYLLTTNVIFVPTASVHNAPADVSASFLTTSFRLKNGTADLFLDEMRHKGLQGSSLDGYTCEFTFYDQGYYRAAGLLESTRQMARVLVIISLITAFESMMLFSYLYILRRKKEISVMRSMGMGRCRIAAEMLFGILLVTFGGIALGCSLGFTAMGAAENRILSDSGEQISSVFSNMYGQDIDKTTMLTLSRSPESFIGTAGVIIGLAVVIVSVFLIVTLAQSPMKLLSGRKE